MREKLEMLFQPLQIGPVRLKNRMIRSPMWSRTSSVEGEVTQQCLDMYEAAAKGGVAMIVVEAIGVTVVEMLPVLAYDMPAMARTYMLQVLLPKSGVNSVTNMHIQEITDSGVNAIDNNWRKHTFECDRLSMHWATCLMERLEKRLTALFRSSIPLETACVRAIC